MKKGAFGLLVLLLAVAFMVMPACDSGGGGGGTTHSLVGTWTCIQANNASDIGKTVTFYADGTGIWAGVPMVYSYSGSTLTVIVAGVPKNFTLAWATDNRIQITNTASGDWIIMVR